MFFLTECYKIIERSKSISGRSSCRVGERVGRSIHKRERFHRFGERTFDQVM